MAKKNRGWVLVCIVAVLPLVKLYGLVNFDFEENGYDFLMFDDYESPPHLAEQMDVETIPGIKFAIHTTGEWSIDFRTGTLFYRKL